MKVYQRLANNFKAEGVSHIFGIMGDGNMYWMHELDKLGVKLLEVRHEGAGLGGPYHIRGRNLRPPRLADRERRKVGGQAHGGRVHGTPCRTLRRLRRSIVYMLNLRRAR